MSTTYEGIGGMGLLFTSALLKAFYEAKITKFSDGYGEDDLAKVEKYLGLEYCRVVEADEGYWIQIKGKNLREITWNSALVFEKLNKVWTEYPLYSTEDLIPISDIWSY